MKDCYNYYKDYIVKLKHKTVEELEQQIVHHFGKRSLSSDDLYNLNVEELKRREGLEEKRKIMKWTKWTFVVALTGVVLALAQLIVQLIPYIKFNIKSWH